MTPQKAIALINRNIKAQALSVFPLMRANNWVNLSKANLVPVAAYLHSMGFTTVADPVDENTWKLKVIV